MRLLLDSHILLWWSAGDSRLGRRAEKLLADEENELYLSAASWWELAVKQVLGRLRIDLADAWHFLQQREIKTIPVTFDHAQKAGSLPAFHSDPFDHMLVAQASFEGFVLLTRDRKLKPYGKPVLYV